MTYAEMKAKKRDAAMAIERAWLIETLVAAGGNVSLAARSAGMDRPRLRFMMVTHDVGVARIAKVAGTVISP